MPEVRFDGHPGRLIAFGYELEAGKSVEMTEEEAAQLAADPNVQVTVLEAAQPSPRPPAARGTHSKEKE